MRTMMTALVLIVLATVQGSGASAATTKPMLVFSIDEAYPNGPVEKRDFASITLMAKTIAKFSSEFSVYALLAPEVTDTDALYKSLDILKQAGVPFILDALASETIGIRPGVHPFDKGHGKEMSTAQLQLIRARYGATFAGIRDTEPFSMSFTIIETQDYGKTWATRFRENWPTDIFYRKQDLTEYVQWASRNGMFTMVSDWLWASSSSGLPPELHQSANEADLVQLNHQYNNTLIALYANNEPNDKSTYPRMLASLQPVKAGGITKLGLSDQSWLCSNGVITELQCNVDLLINWAKYAYDQHFVMVQLEPYYYWWSFPKADVVDNYAHFKQTEANPGRPTDHMKRFGAAFGVQLD